MRVESHIAHSLRKSIRETIDPMRIIDIGVVVSPRRLRAVPRGAGKATLHAKRAKPTTDAIAAGVTKEDRLSRGFSPAALASM